MYNTWYICIYMVRPGDVLGKDACTMHGISHIQKRLLSIAILLNEVMASIYILMSSCLLQPPVALMQRPFA